MISFMAVLIIILILYIVLYSYDKKQKEAKEAQRMQEKFLLEQQRREEAERKAELEARRRKQAIMLFNQNLAQIPDADPAPLTLPQSDNDYKISNITLSNSLSKLCDFVAIDTETTGLSPKTNELTEISAIKYTNFEPVEKISYLIKPKVEITEKITELTGITNEMVAEAPSVENVMPLVQGFVGNYNIVGHNTSFDMGFLTANGFVVGKKQKIYDNLQLSRKMLKPLREVYDREVEMHLLEGDVENHKLTTLCEYYGIYRDDAHRALSDCYATAQIYITQLKELLE